ncbi:hypothetical protein J6590_090315 [Homalodisca vitripennis]|nr:hypothetical protein J6590_090315 [Homalodisca vitripennis]
MAPCPVSSKVLTLVVYIDVRASIKSDSEKTKISVSKDKHSGVQYITLRPLNSLHTRSYVDPMPGVAVVGKESMYSIEDRLIAGISELTKNRYELVDYILVLIERNATLSFWMRVWVRQRDVLVTLVVITEVNDPQKIVRLWLLRDKCYDLSEDISTLTSLTFEDNSFKKNWQHLTSLGKRVLRRRVCNAIQKTPMFRSGKLTRPPAPIQELHLRAAKPELRQQACDRWRRLLASGRGQA